jgi:WhiB family redox-sensing transcriptional regulator
MIPRFKNRPACEGTDTNLWFSAKGNDYPERELLARICNGCPARQECLEYALEYDVDGFWAGTLPRQRSAIRRVRGITAKSMIAKWEQQVRGA